MKKSFFCLCLGLVTCFTQANAREVTQTTGQSLYLPIYSHVTYGDTHKAGRHSITLLSAMVSIRNTDRKNPIKILSANYYDSDGKLLRHYVSKPVLIKPFATSEIFVDSSDKFGGSGASFVMEWSSEAPVSAPVVEAVHISATSGRSLALKTVATEILPPASGSQ